MAYSNKTQVHQANASGQASIALRSGSAGNWLVERWWNMVGTDNKGYWNVVSSHLTEEAAQAAKSKLDRKIAKS